MAKLSIYNYHRLPARILLSVMQAHLEGDYHQENRILYRNNYLRGDERDAYRRGYNGFPSAPGYPGVNH